MDKNTTVELNITNTKHPIYRVTEWDKYQQYSKTANRYVRQMPWFKFYARELLHQRRFVMLEPDKFKFLVLAISLAPAGTGLGVPTECAFSKNLVYSCLGLLNTSSVGPASTISPAFITQTLSAMLRTIPRS